MENFLSTEYDEKLASLPLIKYYPWVGKHYEKGINSKRILVIAESVYDWDEGSCVSAEMLSSPNFSRIVVHEHGLYFSTSKGIANSSTFRNFERAVYGVKDVTDLQLEELWSSVALHQYVQRPMKNLAERPSVSDYNEGFKVLKEVIAELKPDICILWGSGWDKLKPFLGDIVDGSWEEYEKINNAIPKKAIISIEGHKAKLISMRHPSMYFSWDKWHQNVLKDEIT